MTTTTTFSATSGDVWGDTGGTIYPTNNDLVLQVNARTWIPFTITNIFHGATIVGATLKLVAKDSQSGTAVKQKFGCEAADNPSAPANWTELASKTLTTAYLTDNNVAAWTDGTEYTFDITTAVQEIIDRAGWASGNTLAVLIVDNSTTGGVRKIASYEHATYAEPKLEIVYYNGGQFITWSSE